VPKPAPLDLDAEDEIGDAALEALGELLIDLSDEAEQEE
jgi:hypothetical protein